MGWYDAVRAVVNKDSDTDQRYTRRHDFELVEQMFGVRFNLDVAARDAKAAKCKRFYSPAPTPGSAGVDGLVQPWRPTDVVWDNCPWSDIGPWCRRHWQQLCRFSVLYIPNNRAERGWWHQYVEPFLSSSMRYAPQAAARRHGFDLTGLRFTATNLDYRPCFDVPGGGSAGDRPESGVIVLAWDRRKP